MGRPSPRSRVTALLPGRRQDLTLEEEEGPADTKDGGVRAEPADTGGVPGSDNTGEKVQGVS